MEEALTILLDTNALIWLLNSPEGEPLGQQAKKLIADADAVYASSVSVLEVTIKAMLGKIEASETIIEDIASARLKNLSFSMTHAGAIKNFPNLNDHDPFDRMLLAQAAAEGFSLLSSDKTLLNQGFDSLVDARK